MLSPLAPLGSCSAFGCVDQHKVVSAARGLEAMADPSNVLALLLAQRRSRRAHSAPVHLCATARVSRAQAFKNARNFAHFGLFTIVSGGRDRGAFGCEAALLASHLRCYRRLADSLLGWPLQLVFSSRGGYPESFLPAMVDIGRAFLPGADISVAQGDSDNAYYRGLNFKLFVVNGDERIELGDGGFVDWTARLLNNQKERCLISGMGLDRLLMMERQGKGQ